MVLRALWRRLRIFAERLINGEVQLISDECWLMIPVDHERPVASARVGAA
jgi:hypothetical protein